MEQRINKTDLLKFLKGECSSEESIEINQFLKTAAGQNVLNELLNEHWELAKDGEIDPSILSEWKREWSLKFTNEPAKVVSEKKRIDLTMVFRYAAVFTALILGIGIYQVSTRRSNMIQIKGKELVQRNPMGRHSNFSLADGTQVYLGPGSTLSFPEKFSGNSREVQLEGEAYFEVTKNKEKPFIIYSNHIRTQVLGTTFKVNAFKDSPVLVSVTSGRVKVDRIEGDQVQQLAVLLPGEQVSYSAKSGIHKSNFNMENIRNWKQGQLVFDGTPLSELTTQISRWYNVSITISTEKLKQIPITVTLDGNMPVSRFLDGLSASFGFHYTLKDRTITIY